MTKADIVKSLHQLFVLVCVSEIVAAVYQILECYFTAHEHFSKAYLKPLLASGKLKMTIPDKPKSRSQKYITAKEQ